MNIYSKVLALYTSFLTKRRVHLSIKGVNHMLHATLQYIMVRAHMQMRC